MPNPVESIANVDSTDLSGAALAAMSACSANADDLARRFETSDDAIAHCRTLYRQPVTLAPPPGAPDDAELQRIGHRTHAEVVASREAVEQTREHLQRGWDERLKRK